MWEVHSVASVKETYTQGYNTHTESVLVKNGNKRPVVCHVIAPDVRNTSE